MSVSVLLNTRATKAVNTYRRSKSNTVKIFVFTRVTQVARDLMFAGRLQPKGIIANLHYIEQSSASLVIQTFTFNRHLPV